MDYARQTRANADEARAAEVRGDEVVEAWPIKMAFEFTADCNLHCFMCDCEMARDRYREQGIKRFTLPVETFRLIADTAFPHISVVNPTGVGEPLVLSYFDELMEACERYDTKLDIITNGMLLKGERVRRLLPLLAAITFSFDGATKATFDHIRTGAKFETVLRNLENFARLRREMGLREQVRTSFNITIMSENVAELPAIIELAKAHDIDFVVGGYMLVFGDSLRSSSPLLDPARTNHWVAAARARALELGVEVLLPARLPETGAEPIQVLSVASPLETTVGEPIPATETHGSDAPTTPDLTTSDLGSSLRPLPSPPPGAPADPADRDPTALVTGMPPDWQGKMYCHFPWKEVFVSQGGEVSPCCAQGRPVLGNIFEQDFAEIWNGPEYQRLRRGLWTGDLTPYCRDCTFLQEAGSVPYQGDSYLRGDTRDED